MAATRLDEHEPAVPDIREPPGLELHTPFDAIDQQRSHIANAAGRRGGRTIAEHQPDRGLAHADHAFPCAGRTPAPLHPQIRQARNPAEHARLKQKGTMPAPRAFATCRQRTATHYSAHDERYQKDGQQVGSDEERHRMSSTMRHRGNQRTAYRTEVARTMLAKAPGTNG